MNKVVIALLAVAFLVIGGSFLFSPSGILGTFGPSEKIASVNSTEHPAGFVVPEPAGSPEYFRGKDKVMIVVGATVLSAEVADSPEEWRNGLSGRSALAQNEGMLFAFPYEDFHSFWMKDMNFPIDIIWISADFRIVDIAKRVSPSSFPATFQPKEKARYALEVNAGWSDEHAVQAGELVDPVRNFFDYRP